MKLYDYKPAPSPRRVRIFLAEKNIEVPTEQIDLRAQSQLGEEFRRLNPQCAVPYLVLDDGTGIGESMAICRYFEALYPEPPLFGRTPVEQGQVEMWNRVMEFDGYLAVAEAFRNAAPGFKDRALPGPLPLEQIPALAERGRLRVARFFDALDERLGATPFVAGDRYSVADITALVTVDFAGWIKLGLGAQHGNARRWHEQLASRPATAA
ncbi:MAG: glutathione S-transferase [Gammaproteobacteria bacterium]|nr:glutathione S-transferase [Gammaproteobacteria bacterium]